MKTSDLSDNHRPQKYRHPEYYYHPGYGEHKANVAYDGKGDDVKNKLLARIPLSVEEYLS